jgi:hypothetical protein
MKGVVSDTLYVISLNKQRSEIVIRTTQKVKL